MKETYTVPEMEIIGFDNEDVITTSGFNNGGTEGEIGDGNIIHIP